MYIYCNVLCIDVQILRHYSEARLILSSFSIYSDIFLYIQEEKDRIHCDRS